MEVVLVDPEHMCFSFSKSFTDCGWEGENNFSKNVVRKLPRGKKKNVRRNTNSFFQKKNLDKVVSIEQLVLCCVRFYFSPKARYPARLSPISERRGPKLRQQ